MNAPTLNYAWWLQLGYIMGNGRSVSPRGQQTLEVPSKTLVFDMNYPVVVHPGRKLGYKFMAAEAWFILSGRDDVASIAPYSKAISQFSDDGETFFGAYGPRVVSQLDYVVQALKRDPYTRQALLTTWRPKPLPSKDIPCTVAMDFLLRGNKLEAHVFMRSSDNWLGVPYDAFNFSMIAAEIVRQLNQEPANIELGDMYLTAASSHIYGRDIAAVNAVLDVHPEIISTSSRVPPDLLHASKPHYVANCMQYLKDTEKGDSRRWWE